MLPWFYRKNFAIATSAERELYTGILEELEMKVLGATTVTTVSSKTQDVFGIALQIAYLLMQNVSQYLTVDCIQETQTTSATTLGSHVSCAEKSVPSLDKGKHKMYEVCHEHHPFAEDLISVSDHSNEAHLICNLHCFFYFTVDCIQETQTTSATTLGSHVSCAEKSVPSLDKGKHKMYEVCHEHHPFAEDLINVLLCIIFHTFILMLVAFVPAMENLDMIDDNETTIASSLSLLIMGECLKTHGKVRSWDPVDSVTRRLFGVHYVNSSLVRQRHWWWFIFRSVKSGSASEKDLTKDINYGLTALSLRPYTHRLGPTTTEVKRRHAENYDHGSMMETSLLAMAWELEKLHVEMATAEKEASRAGTNIESNSMPVYLVIENQIHTSCNTADYVYGVATDLKDFKGCTFSTREVIPILNWETETFSKPVLAVLIFASVALFSTIFFYHLPLQCGWLE
ncbi:SNARE associated Golgi protein family [Artemisia annua]|uniref:SNARE associated Golgi protein family n=1 Tax=Artemisia annua TaxID=35608 RepID=A0A2U1NEP3_ARTAN|nr:SNARE associated Golgi protein family [Artemisia annua]